MTTDLNKFKRGLIKTIIFFVLMGMFFVIMLSLFKVPQQMSLELSVSNKMEDTFQVYFMDKDSKELTEEYSEKKQYSNPNENETLKFKTNTNIMEVRLDLGTNSSTMTIKNLVVTSFFGKYSLMEFVTTENSNQIAEFKIEDKGINIQTIGSDPYISIAIPEQIKSEVLQDNRVLTNIICLIISFILSGIAYLFLKSRKEVIGYLRELVINRSLIMQLSVNDFKTRYAGSYFGVLWAFVQPVVTVLIYWFVFEVGFRSGKIQEAPFILWLVAGIVPWFFFAEALGSSTNALIEYSYLVKKLVFQIRILPVVKIISAFYVHVFFVLFTVLLFSIYGYYPDLGYFQMIYYTICAFCLVISLSLITSSLIVFFKDFGQIISIALQFGMWLTPILWHYTMLPRTYQWILKINPVYYIVEGYRDSLIGGVWFWERYNQTVYFWAITGILFLAGIIIMRKLKPHFADVL